MVSPRGSYVTRLENLGYRWVQWEVGRQSLSPPGEVDALNRLRAIYRMEKPNLVHHFTAKPVLYGTIAARLEKIPGIVNCITGLGFLFLSQDWKARMIRPFIKLLYRLSLMSDHVRVIFENEEDQRYFRDHQMVDEEKTFLIPGVGVDVEMFAPAPEPSGTPVVIFPARMLWDKGVALVVEAARILKKRQVPARFILVGKPDAGNPTSVDEAMLRRWEQEGLAEYWGWQEDMSEVFRQGHIVTLPSMYEGVPTALLEAAACGKPLVATDIPGCRAVVRDGVNGFLVPVNQAQALAEALEKLILDPALRARMGAAGRQLILEQFTDASVNEGTYAVYRSLLDD